ncbi:MAG: hypothetical protein C4523_00810 [Myxococcales bacterium]|nr:MAG: hypothetical protein C4523_00810 [Myxococcales bacterium]
MRSIAALLSAIVVLTVFFSRPLAADEATALLKGIGPKKAPVPSVGLLLRDDLKALFKNVMAAYFAEDKEKFLSYFNDQITMGSLTLQRKKPQATKDDLAKRIDKEFAAQDFKQLALDDAFDSLSPTMMFVLSEEQMRSNIPVWGFAAEPQDIVKFMQPGDYLVIANTLPDALDKVLLPATIYLIVRKIGDQFKVVGLD